MTQLTHYYRENHLGESRDGKKRVSPEKNDENFERENKKAITILRVE